MWKKKWFSFVSNLQTYHHFKLDFPKVDQHTWGKWFIHGTDRRNILTPVELIFFWKKNMKI